MRDIDIVNDIKTREAKISNLQDEISALKKVAEIYGLSYTSTASLKEETRVLENPETFPKTTGANIPIPIKQKFGTSKWHKPIGDAAEEILQKETNGLHIDTIHSKLAEQGITPTRNSLDAALRKDPKKRFGLVRVRTYGLLKTP